MDKNTNGNTWLKGLLLSLLSGLLLAAAFPPSGFGLLAWVALAPLFVALMKFAPSGAAFGAYYGISLAVWLLGMIRGVTPGYEVLYAAPVVVFAAVFLFTFWQRRLLTALNYRFFTAVTAASFVAFEFARQTTPFVQFGFLGISQYRQPWAIQIASVFGVSGVSLMIVLSNCVIALVVANMRELSKVKVQVVSAALVFAALAGINLYLLSNPPKTIRTVRVAAVQYGYAPELKTNPQDKFSKEPKYSGAMGRARLAVDLLGPMTLEAARKGAKLVVWPEVVIEMDNSGAYDVQRDLSALAARAKVYLIAPYNAPFPGREKEFNPPSKNGAYVIAPDGSFVGDYVKQHRVTSFDIDRGAMGHVSIPYETPMGRMGVMICYDADFPDVTMEYVKNGAEFFALPSHDLSMFVTRHHPALLLFRSVEHRRAIIKADIVQGTLITDSMGRILADPPDGLRMAMADVPVTDEVTPYRRFGRLPGLAALFLLPTLLLIAKGQSRGV